MHVIHLFYSDLYLSFIYLAQPAHFLYSFHFFFVCCCGKKIIKCTFKMITRRRKSHVHNFYLQISAGLCHHSTRFATGRATCAISNAYVEIPNELMVDHDEKYDFCFKCEYTTFIHNLSLILFFHYGFFCTCVRMPTYNRNPFYW